MYKYKPLLLSSRAQSALLIMLSNMTEAEVLSLPGCGRRTLNEFKDELFIRGLSFKEELPHKEFSERDFALEELKIKYALKPIAFLVRYRDSDFIVIEYKTGGIYKLPVKELGSLIRVELNKNTNALLRVQLSELVVGRIVRPNYWSRIPKR